MVTTAAHIHTTRPTHLQKKLPDDIDRWLDRNQASDLLGVSVSTLQNLEKRGRLHPLRVTRLDGQGAERPVFVYNPTELATIPRRDRGDAPRSPGECAARAFELFDMGKSLREIVIELRVLPDLVIELREKWSDMGGSDRVIAPLAWDRLESLLGEFSTISDLIERIEALVARPPTPGSAP